MEEMLIYTELLSKESVIWGDAKEIVKNNMGTI